MTENEILHHFDRMMASYEEAIDEAEYQQLKLERLMRQFPEYITETMRSAFQIAFNKLNDMI